MKTTNSIDKLENVINGIINYGLDNLEISKEFSDEFKSLEKNSLVNVDKIIKKILETRIGDFKDKFVNEFIVEDVSKDSDLEKNDLVNVDKIIKKILEIRIGGDFKNKFVNDFIVEDASKDSEDSNESKCDTCKDKETCFSLMSDENDDSDVPPSVKKVLEAFFGKKQTSDKEDTEDTKDTKDAEVAKDTKDVKYVEDVEDEEDIDEKYFMLPMEEFENFQKLLKAIKTLKLNLDIKDLYKVKNGVFYFNTPKGKNSFDTKRIN